MIKATIVTLASLSLGVGFFITPKHPTQEEVHVFEPTLRPNSTPIEQAKTLLRKVNLTGKCSSELPTLDPNFEARVGQSCAITRDQLRAYLSQIHVNEWEIGGTLDMPVSSRTDGNGNITYAKYLVIHDTSFPRYDSSIPSNINDDSWEWNSLKRWMANVTHVFVNRLGDSKTMTPFNEGKTATKLERYVMGDGASKGLYLHVELIQPRCSKPGYGRHNDVQAPTPGFTDAQYRRLALIYTAASVRKGEWMIPAFHACVDSGIKYAHDDPQNFELEKLFGALNDVWSEIDAMNFGGVKVGSGSGQ